MKSAPLLSVCASVSPSAPKYGVKCGKNNCKNQKKQKKPKFAPEMAVTSVIYEICPFHLGCKFWFFWFFFVFTMVFCNIPVLRQNSWLCLTSVLNNKFRDLA